MYIDVILQKHFCTVTFMQNMEISPSPASLSALLHNM